MKKMVDLGSPRRIPAKGGFGGGAGVPGWGGTVFHPLDDPQGGGHSGKWSVALQPKNPVFAGKDWSYYDYTNKQAPWVGLEGPANKLGQPGPKAPDGRPTYYIDSKSPKLSSREYNKPGLMVHGTYGRHGVLKSVAGSDNVGLPHTVVQDIFGRNTGAKGSGAPTRKYLAEGLTAPLLATPFAPLRPFAKMAVRGVVGAIQRQGEKKAAARAAARQLQPAQRRAVQAVRNQGQPGRARQAVVPQEFSKLDMSRAGDTFRQNDPRELGLSANEVLNQFRGGANYNPMPSEAPTDWSNSWLPQKDFKATPDTTYNPPTSETVQPSGPSSYTDVSVGGGDNFTSPGGEGNTATSPDHIGGTGTWNDPKVIYSTSNPEGQMLQANDGSWTKFTRQAIPATANAAGMPSGSNVPTDESGVASIPNTYRPAEDDTGDGAQPVKAVTRQAKVNPLAHKMDRYDPRFDYGSVTDRPGRAGGEWWDPSTSGPTVGSRDIGAYGAQQGGGSYFHGLQGGRFQPLPGSFAGLGQGSAGTIFQGGPSGYDYFADASRRAAQQGRDPSLGVGTVPMEGDWNTLIKAGSMKPWTSVDTSNWAKTGATLLPAGQTNIFGGKVDLSKSPPIGEAQPKLSSAITSRPDRKAAALGGLIRPVRRPLKSYGSDTVPIAAKPGEIIANEAQQSALMPVPGREHLLLPEQLAALRRAKVAGGLPARRKSSLRRPVAAPSARFG